MRTLTNDSTYLLIFAEAERATMHRLHTQAYVYNGHIDVLAEEVLQSTISRLPHDALSEATLTDLREVCMSAAQEGMVNYYRRGIA